MSRSVRGFAALVGIIAFLVGAANPAFATPTPLTAKDLGSLSTPTVETNLGYSSAYAINDRGVTVGTAVAPDGSVHGVRWGIDGTIRDLGVDIYPTDINNSGTIIGTVGNGTNAPGFTWKKGVFDYPDGPAAFKINMWGQALLKRTNASGLPTYYFRDVNEYQITEFPQGYELSDLNNLAQVIGTKRGATSAGDNGFVWQVHVGITRDFGPSTRGFLINDKGHVVKGEIRFCEDGCQGDVVAIYLDANGQHIQILGHHTPLAMNEKDQVVGHFHGGEGLNAATFWGKGAGFSYLQYESSFDDEIAARDINESTQIVGASQMRLRPDGEGFFTDLTRATMWIR